MINRQNSEQLFNKAKNLFPGGVNSPVRAFKSVDGVPLFIKKGDGCRIWDEDDNEFIDFCCSWGPLILGHNNPKVRTKIEETLQNGTSFGAPTKLENELGDLILSNNRFIDKIRFVSSGTEAVMSGIRLARGFTGRDKIIKFDGCYHGHADSLLVKAGSGLATFGTSSSAGVPESFSKETIVLPLNDEAAVNEAISKYKDEIACIIIEPIPANNGLLIQTKEYLQFLRKVCTENGILLFFDEVISGFRVAFSGAAELYDIQPDIISYGKIIGGGLPVGAYGASNEIMNHISPMGNVYQAGTLSGNPVAMAAGIAQLSECLKNDFYTDQEARTQAFVGKINAHAAVKGYTFEMFSIGSIFWLAFSDSEAIRSAAEIRAESMEDFKKLYAILLDKGIYLGPSGYEVGFVSAAHTVEVLDQVAADFCDALDTLFQG
ncbi:glutamate-1-semialdehyde 2,1-aminomutase [Paracrocinitomix mangrovi]|uniref:glutamate-1-semialdehyde 2,1-aminomutase n=1 Tax=Paracrocinitomix mangrovi TaxID=2862509 RepID=UPI001C8ED647|nr:glutamate-1-semialdehyde 2,1-aminomutase [Paracrocinitomix mangrovi]UKN00411.1 glutamate-1-semialdehyde 2,1-aminomutase [Paracrocinitomix mangrovi]